MPSDMEDASDKYKELHQEIQLSEEATVFVMCLIDMQKKGMAPENLLAIAFSHGVMVGMEMEKL